MKLTRSRTLNTAILWVGTMMLLLTLVWVRSATAQPTSNFSDFVRDLLGEWQERVAHWRTAGFYCFLLTLGVGVLGIVVGAIQAIKAPWVRAAAAAIGIVVSILTFVRSQTFEGDHRTYYRAAESADLRLGKIRRFMGPLADDAERKNATEEVRKLTLELDAIAARLPDGTGTSTRAFSPSLSTNAFAQSSPGAQKPDWLNGRASDPERVYFVGVALNASIETAKAESLENAVAAAREDIASRVTAGKSAGPDGGKGVDPTIFGGYLAEGATVLDQYYERHAPDQPYRYYTLIALSKRRIQSDSVLFGYRERTVVPKATVEAAQSVQPSPVEYQIKKEAVYQTLAVDAQRRVGAEAFAAYEIGRAARKRGDIAFALRSLGSAVRIAPDFFLAWYNLALAQEVARNATEADGSYKRAVELEPRQPVRESSVYNSYGWYLYRQGRLNEARSMFERAVEIDPLHVVARRNLDVVRGQLKTP